MVTKPDKLHKVPKLSHEERLRKVDEQLLADANIKVSQTIRHVSETASPHLNRAFESVKESASAQSIDIQKRTIEHTITSAKWLNETAAPAATKILNEKIAPTVASAAETTSKLVKSKVIPAAGIV